MTVFSHMATCPLARTSQTFVFVESYYLSFKVLQKHSIITNINN